MDDGVVFFVVLIAGAASLIWWDARRLGLGTGDGILLRTSPVSWAIGCLLLPILVIPYLFARTAAQKQVCPKCAERVNAAAKVCRFCGAGLA